MPSRMLIWMPVAAAVSCDNSAQSSFYLPDTVGVVGEPGRGPGQFATPRAAAIGPNDELFVVDKTGRIQRFDRSGRFLSSWTLPYVTDATRRRVEQDTADRPAGFPVGMSFDPQGRLYVADTHYYRILIYTVDGQMVGQFGSHGREAGQFLYPTSVAFDAQGNVFVAEYGGNDRIQKFTPDGKFLSQFGSPGKEPGRFSRPQAIQFDGEGRLWVADACNHRICVYSDSGELLRTLGEFGREPGRLHYPYGMTWDREGNLVVSEFGNNRIQKLSPEGKSLEVWGRLGSGSDELRGPWSVAIDSQNTVYVVDSGNSRVVRFAWP